LLAQIEDLQRVIKDADAPMVGDFKLGSSRTLATFNLSSVINKLKIENPLVDFKIQLANSPKNNNVYEFLKELSCQKIFFKRLDNIPRIYQIYFQPTEIMKKYFATIEIEKEKLFNSKLESFRSIKITKEEYRETINSIIDFFSGNIKELEDYLNSKMKEYSEKKNYEQALDYKNKIELLENIINRQNVRDISNNDIDILSVYIYSKLAVVNVFSIVKGVLLNKQNFIVQTNNFIDWYDDVGDEYKQNIITEFVKQNYINSISNNKTIVIYDDKYIDKEQLIGLNVKIRKYKTKSELGLIEMGEKNCESYINKEQINFVVLEKIKNKINLDKIPKRIECFDISNIQGKYAVGSMSVFIDGLPSKDNYRKFKIRMKNEPDDPMMMREVLGRRLSKKNLTEWGVPDLIVIDGGLTQLGAVLRAFNESKKNIEINKILSKIEIVSLAKKEEEVFYYKDGDIKKVSGKDLYILRQIRDEAHRFGIGYFRNRYRKQFSLQNK